MKTKRDRGKKEEKKKGKKKKKKIKRRKNRCGQGAHCPHCGEVCNWGKHFPYGLHGCPNEHLWLGVPG